MPTQFFILFIPKEFETEIKTSAACALIDFDDSDLIVVVNSPVFKVGIPLLTLFICL